ncbi:MAG: GyrI-like domain-containing protein [Thermoleophilia bacterium]|nr:GyrI-like domain-containing protein [Thermoleophilia bacterium]
MTTKLDLRKELKHLYMPSAKAPVLVQVPPMHVLAVDGEGPPGGEAFQAALQALFTLAYSVRFAAKQELDLDYPVMPPEGLYWHAGGGELTAETSHDQMAWTLQMMIPDQVPEDFVERVQAETAAKGKGGPHLSDVRLRTFAEGPSAQIMHIGPYDAESATIARLVAFAEEQGYQITGKHHEIYIGDPNRAAADKLKTTLRLGVTKVE